jgi:hypothetical protein
MGSESRVGIPSGNETADNAAKEALNEEIHHTETYNYLPQDLIKWIKEKWENSTTTMKERKPHNEHKPLNEAI